MDKKHFERFYKFKDSYSTLYFFLGTSVDELGIHSKLTTSSIGKDIETIHDHPCYDAIATTDSFAFSYEAPFEDSLVYFSVDGDTFYLLDPIIFSVMLGARIVII